jgi:hypothetical protein
MKNICKSLITIAVLIFLSSNSFVKAQNILMATDDVLIQGGASSGINFNTLPSNPGDALRVRSTVSADSRRNTYIKFDLGSIPGSISKAELQITLDRAINSNSPGGSVLDRADFYTVQDDSWSETTLTWDTSPMKDKYILSQIFNRRGSSDPDTVYRWDVTEFVQTEFSGDKKITFFLTDTMTTNGTDLRMFSKETPGNEPLLIVTNLTEINITDQLPMDFILKQNYPNPFNPSTVIEYSLPITGYVDVSIYNVLGQKISTLFKGEASAGTHSLEWDGKNFSGDNLPAGIYLSKIEFKGKSYVIKMVLNR